MKSQSETPKFQKGDTARLLHFTPPILSGSIVAVQQVGKGRRYLVKATEYNVHSVWVDEVDLDWVIG